ncbi:hypothetical protein [Streptomyces sp. NPDC059071]|uniref:hypothetical protein n=1 Tax=unclassified Streptomyces TaxID=2593676 RepID=UPI00364D345F
MNTPTTPALATSTEHGNLPPAPPLIDPEHRTPLAEHTAESLAELYDRLRDAEGELHDTRVALQEFYRCWKEQHQLLADQATLGARVHNALLSVRRRMATSSRDWGAHHGDAWLYALLIGWDCEQEHEHTGDCPALLDEMAAQHGWSANLVAVARKHRAALALAGPNGETDAQVARAAAEEED